MRAYDDKYAKLALTFSSKISKKVGKELPDRIAPTLWALADYLESVDDGKHDQHLLMLGSKWLKQLH